MRAIISSLALVLLACGQNKAAPVPPPSPSSSIVVAPLPTSRTYRASFSHFIKDDLFECVDLERVVTDGGADPFEGFEVKEAKRIPKTCGETFAGRSVLATCKDKESGTVAHFFDFETVGLSDGLMKDCLEDGGEWSALPRDSREFKRAKLDHATKQLHAASKALR